MKNPNAAAQVYFPNLDALRFFCFLSVFFVHSFATKEADILADPLYSFLKARLFVNGNLGVNFFFVLSGFLITYLLLAEKLKNGAIDIRKFYMRRVLRIWPLFFFCVFFGFVIFPLLKTQLGGGPSTETAQVIHYLFFVNNLAMVQNGLPDSSILVILWSVAIEEQFYLFWPLIVGFIAAKKLPYVFYIIIAGSFIFRYLNAGNNLAIEFHTLSCISDMAVGGLGAYLIFFNSSFKKQIQSAPRFFIAGVYIASLIIFLYRLEIFYSNSFLIGLDRLIISLLFLFIILEQNFATNSFFKLRNLKRISKLGQYTYGLYCLHMIAILIVATMLTKLGLNKFLWQVLFLEGMISLAVALLLAFLSYHFYEKRFLKIKEKFAVVKSKPQKMAVSKNAAPFEALP